MHPLGIVVVLVGFGLLGIYGQFSWQRPDGFEEIKKKMDRVNAENCQVRQKYELYLPADAVSHIYDVTEINPIFPNRTALRHLYNVALTRGYFYSFILHRQHEDGEPGLMYYYLGAVADVAANPSINASAIFYDNNSSYPNWYRNYFNRTLPLFGPRAVRFDDFNDPLNPGKASTLNTCAVDDLGVIQGLTTNYTNDLFKTNDWFSMWLPDPTYSDYRKTTYSALIKHANGTEETFDFFGPPGPAENPGPVKWTKPYFDCGRSNKWIVSVTVPIPDLYPRNTGWRHLQRHKYVAVAVTDMNFIEIDINQCPIGLANPGPNKFANTARCKYNTTECEPLHGWGFRRGGYMCRCKPGFRLPHYQRGPFLGEVIERATKEEYEQGFDCIPIGRIQFITVITDPERANIVKRDADPEDEHNHEHIRNKRYLYGDQAPILNVLSKMNIVNDKNCMKYKAEELRMAGDVLYDKDKQFENEARTALRLAHFLSVYLQKVDPTEFFTDRYSDKDLNEWMIYGEVIANVMANTRILSSGVYFDYNKFPNKTLFGPMAYRLAVKTVTPHSRGETNFFAMDSAALTKKQAYVNQEWFKILKTRWGPDPEERLTKYIARMKIRGNPKGTYRTKFDHYPEVYWAPVIEDGYWTQPYFDCDGINKFWLVTYAAPFFGHDKLRSKNNIEFRGVVTVTMKLMLLDINQCTAPPHVPNAFKNTDRCDYKTTECIPIMGRGFEMGGYKCECIQGYEYPFNNPIIYFDGQVMDAEWYKLLRGKVNKFDGLKCRIAGASCAQISLLSLLAVILVTFGI